MADTESTPVRALTPEDFDNVVAIDNKLFGASREGFYKKRLAAAVAKPKDFIYVGVDHGGALTGFAFAQLLKGEFGGRGTVAVLDAIGVDPDHEHEGLGRSLIDGLVGVMRDKGVHELRTEVDWKNSKLLRFLSANGFETSPRLVLERETRTPLEHQ